MNRIAYIYLLAGVAGLAACSTDEECSGSSGQGNAIVFNAVEASQWETRGAQVGESRSLELASEGLQQPLFLTATVTEGFRPVANATGTAACTNATGTTAATRGTKVTSLDQLDHFGVSAFLQKTTDASLGAPGYFYNLKASKNANDDYVVTQNYYWPATDECLHFYAYYPYNSGADPAAEGDNTDVVLSAADATGAPVLSYTVNSVVASQADLMTAVAIDAATPNAVTQPTVTLPFRHELCAVSFKIADNLFPVTGGIVSIALKGIYGSGTMTINKDANGTWDFSGITNEQRNATAFTATINKTNTENLDNGKMIADNLTFLMIPQELTDDAVIEMVYQDNAQNYTLTASLKEALKITDTQDANVGKAFFEAGKTITFALTSTTLSTLKIGTITWPNAYSQSLPKNAYVSGDVAGLYVVQDDNTTIRYANIPVTFNGTSWEIDHETAAGVIYAYPGDHYYLYYPRVALNEQDYPLNGQGANKSTADVDFFSSIITGWGRTINAPITGDSDRRDQSQEDGFTAADLHIAELTTAGGGGRVSTVGATMKHAMGLAVFSLATVNQMTYSLDSDPNYTFTVTTASRTSSANFNGQDYIPYKKDNSTYYYWVKPSTTLSVSTTGAESWSENVNVALNASTIYIETPITTAVHTLAIGDVFFTDGSVGATGNAYPYDTKTPAGIVFALNNEMATADKTAGYTHGYVFSLKDANSAQASHQWSTLSNNDVDDNYVPDVTWSATTDMSVTEGVIKDVNATGQNGRAISAHIGNNSNYPAFAAAHQYNNTVPTNTNKSSYWFLPSIAQWWLVCKNLGDTELTDKRSNDANWNDGSSLWGVYYSNNSSNRVHQGINTHLAKAGAKGTVYNPIQGGSAADEDADMSAASYVVYWSSSEWSGAGYAFYVPFGSYGNLGFERSDAKSHAFRVRPVLAF